MFLGFGGARRQQRNAASTSQHEYATESSRNNENGPRSRMSCNGYDVPQSGPSKGPHHKQQKREFHEE